LSIEHLFLQVEVLIILVELLRHLRLQRIAVLASALLSR
jgi:hypothetical protein